MLYWRRKTAWPACQIIGKRRGQGARSPAFSGSRTARRKKMVAMMLASFADVRKARQCVHDLAQAAGIDDPSAAALVTGELGNNCVEHGSPAPALLRIGCKP